MTHNAQWYRDAMNELEKQLTDADRSWFSELREYTTLGAFMRDETTVTRQQHGMMLDLVAAERDGGDAERFFGKEPKEMADDLLKQLPPASWRDKGQLLGLIVGISWLVMLISGGMTNGAMSINVLTYLAVPVLNAVMIFGVLTLMRAQIYPVVRLIKSRIAGFFVIWAVMFLYVGANLATVRLMPAVLVIAIPFGWDIALVGVATIFACALILRLHDRLFTPMAFMALVIGVITILRLLWQQLHFVSKQGFTAVVLGVLAVALVIFTIWSRQAAKHVEK
ncbi:hypothetical protein [Lacticaseibacillus mingshuiensis]|uniref:hypothetical protein n=1 Tax=Lacticaseibacillus mingshuiensis TaxID=2799574 RepID=UPI00194F8958|nr:hypothetical protein [Lacticaseibacillus mingshuiensis]